MSRHSAARSCVPLVVHSHYSLCRGVSSPARLIEEAVANGYPALALTDQDNLYGAIGFYREARSAGLKPILGAEVTESAVTGTTGDPGSAGRVVAARDVMAAAPAVCRRAAASGVTPGARAVCLVRNMEGYSNLCRLLTRRMMDPDFRLAAVLPDVAAGLHVLTDDIALARSLVLRLSPGSLWLLLADPPRSPGDWKRLTALSREIGVPCAASPDVMWIEESGRDRHRTASAIRTKDLVTRVPEGELAPPGSIFPRRGRIVERFRDFPGALVANAALREECGDFELTLGRPIFPKYPLPPGEGAYAFVFRRCLEGMRRRYGGLDPAAMRRLTSELEVIDRLGFNEYFVIVGDICRFAHESGIPTVGRGSGAGSIVAYLLGITNVDPLRYRLYFERFLHDKRRDLPDLDIDLCWRRRDDVIEHVYKTYGADKVAMISTHNTFQLRGAFRDVARAHGISPETVDRWSRSIPHHSSEPLSAVVARGIKDPDLTLDDPRVRAVVADAEHLVGAPRHLGIHCGGIVIGDVRLDSYVPLEEATKGIVVTQYEMHAIEAIGLVKIDLLGNRAISVISEAIRLVEESGGPKIDPTEIPDGDPGAADCMSRGDTLGVFQLESPGMRNLCRQLETSDLNGAIAALSLIRPGPAGSGMKERFIRRARGVEPVTYADPRLAQALGETYGVLLYEEDVMLVAATLARLSLAEGDLLRRAIAEIEDADEGDAVARTFLAQAIRNNTPPPVAEEIWGQLRQFAAFGFCKAHASGYGVLAYREAWLKAHYPGAFAVAILNNHTAMYEPRVHLEDARRHGVPIRLPCVNRSGPEYALEDGAAIRVGLGRVRGLTEETIERIVAERPYTSLTDFLWRVRPQYPEAENLVLAGAFDFTGAIRPALLCELKLSWRNGSQRAKASGSGGFLFPVEATGVALPELNDFDMTTRRRFEYEVLGLSPDAHPMTLFDTEGLLPSKNLQESGGRRVRMGGIVAARRRVPVKKSGEPMLFLTLEDVDGLFECTLFPKVYRRYGALLRDDGPYVVEGRAEDQYGAVTVNVEALRAWR